MTLFAATGPVDLIQSSLTGLQADVNQIIPVALGIGVTVFGARKLWSIAKRFVN